jgi:Family of unknown function (DUF6496)
MAKYSTGAQKGVESAMKRMEKGKLRSGKSNKKVTNPKQAIAIGLSEAREKGAKVPPPPKKSASKKATAKNAKKVAAKKSVKSAAAKPVKAASKKSTAVKTKIANKNNAEKKSKEQPEKTVMPAEGVMMNKAAGINNNMDDQLPPVQEKSSSIPPVKNQGPMMAVDKKAVEKLTTKMDPKHNMPISSTPKNALKPSGKKPLWNR